MYLIIIVLFILLLLIFLFMLLFVHRICYLYVTNYSSPIVTYFLVANTTGSLIITHFTIAILIWPLFYSSYLFFFLSVLFYVFLVLFVLVGPYLPHIYRYFTHVVTNITGRWPPYALLSLFSLLSTLFSLSCSFSRYLFVFSCLSLIVAHVSVSCCYFIVICLLGLLVSLSLLCFFLSCVYDLFFFSYRFRFFLINNNHTHGWAFRAHPPRSIVVIVRP